MKRILCAALLLCLLLGGCGSGPQKYTAERYDLFDTLIFVTAYSESRESFDQMAQLMFEEFQRLHGLFDIYGDGSEGLSRLNAHAGGAAVEVEPEVMQLLKLGKDGYDLTDGKVNIAMGAVLKLWSQARENAMNDEDSAAPPSMESLQEAAQHCCIDDLVLDEQAGTAQLLDKDMSIDAGAIAKGFATGLAADLLRENGYTDFVISAGGNVWAEGTPPGSDGWRVGVQSPDESGQLLTTLTVSDCAVVTSGGYLRYFTADGVQYHHIIDPETLMPSQGVLSATVVYRDSGVADLFSTACFMLPENESAALAEKLDGARLIVLTRDGELKQYP